MRRRALLAILGSVSAGCLSSLQDGSSEATPEETVTPNPSDSIQLDCYNETHEEQLCQYSIIQNEATISDGKIEIPAREFTSIDTEIETVGEYELNISVNNIGEEAYPFNVGDYALRMGSNLVIWIYENEIQMGMEE